MIRQQIKDVYFGLVRVLVLPNTLLTRLRYARHAATGTLRLHLGCGPHYLPGMINIDGNLFRRKDLWLDLRNALPFPNCSASLVYCSHMLEHLFPDDALRLLREMRRVLTDDGVARLAVPSLEHALVIARGEAEMRFPREFTASESPIAGVSRLPNRQDVGRLGSPIGGPAQAINYLFCDGQHKYGYCWELLEDFARQAGFTRIANYSAQHGVAAQEYAGVTLGPEPPGSLVVELRR